MPAVSVSLMFAQVRCDASFHPGGSTKSRAVRKAAARGGFRRASLDESKATAFVELRSSEGEDEKHTAGGGETVSFLSQTTVWFFSLFGKPSSFVMYLTHIHHPQRAGYSPLKRFVTALGAGTAAAIMIGGAGVAYAEDAPEALFTKTCAGCHVAGGNIVQAGATLFPAGKMSPFHCFSTKNYSLMKSNLDQEILLPFLRPRAQRG